MNARRDVDADNVIWVLLRVLIDLSTNFGYFQNMEGLSYTTTAFPQLLGLKLNSFSFKQQELEI